MKYFTIKELCNSTIASQKGIDNTPNQDIINNLTLLIDRVLDPIREKWGKPIIINSGYRCDELNKAVGGVKTSQHRLGMAADITTGDKENNKKLFELIKSINIDFDQLIDESNFTWMHISYNKDKNRKQILSL